MRKIVYILVGVLSLVAMEASAQVDKRDVRRGNRDYKKENYKEAEIEYRDEAVPGSRVMGYGSPKLLYGQFRNDELGNYTRYTYTNSTSAIIIRLDGEVLVLADESPELTEALYEGLVAKVGEAK